MAQWRLSCLVLLLAAVALAIGAQEPRYRVLQDGKWGFIDAEGRVVVEPQYDYAYRYKNGHTVVVQGDMESGKRSYIDLEGTRLTGFSYDRAYHFVNGYARAVVNGSWGFVRLDGSTLGAFRYSGALDFRDGYAGVRVGSDRDHLWGMIDTQGREVLPIAFERLSYAGEGRWWVGRSWSEWALYEPGDPAPSEFPYRSRDSFDDGYLIVSRDAEAGEGSDRIYRLLDTRLNVVYESESRIAGYANSIVLESDSDGMIYRRLDGTPVREERFHAGRPFEGGVARVAVGTNWQDRKWGIMGRDGAYRMPPRYTSLSEFDDNGLARFRIGERFGFVNRRGNEITSRLWDSAGYFADGLAPVERDGLWGYIDTEGDIAIDPRYDYAWEFVDGYTVVRYGDRETGQRLYINTEGDLLNRARYGWAYVFDGPLAHIARGPFSTGEFGYINRDGEVIWEMSN